MPLQFLSFATDFKEHSPRVVTLLAPSLLTAPQENIAVPIQKQRSRPPSLIGCLRVGTEGQETSELGVRVRQAEALTAVIT